MTPRERVIKTLKFDYPDRVPRDLWILPISLEKYREQIRLIQEKYPLDIDSDWTNLNRKGREAYEIGTYRDEWGCKFENIQRGVMGEVKEPLVKSLSDVRRVSPPYRLLDKMTEEVAKNYKATDKFTLAYGGSLFERMQFLRGTANLLIDLVDRPPELFRLMEIVHRYNVTRIRKLAKTSIDGILFADDWGAQNSLLISPKLWRELFKPWYKEYCEIAHDNNKFFFMHSDGHIIDIYEDLVEIEIDAINSQLFCMNMEEIGKRFKGRITFWGEIDRQHILASPDLGEVRRAVAFVKKHLYDKRGGIIAQCEFSAGSRPENVMAVFEEWDKC